MLRSLPAGTVAGAHLRNIVGSFDDGWCEQLVSFDLIATQDLAACDLGLWTKGQGGGQAANFSFRVGEAPPFRFALQPETPVRVQVRCPVAAGAWATVRLYCDYAAEPSGGDIRKLSFVLNHFSFVGAQRV